MLLRDGAGSGRSYTHRCCIDGRGNSRQDRKRTKSTLGHSLTDSIQAGLLVILTRSQLSQKPASREQLHRRPHPRCAPSRPPRPAATLLPEPELRLRREPRQQRRQDPATGSGNAQRALPAAGTERGPGRTRPAQRLLPARSAGAGTGRPRRVLHSSPQLFTSSAPRTALPPSPTLPKHSSAPPAPLPRTGP